MKIVRRRYRAGKLDLLEAAGANGGHAVDLLQDAFGQQDSGAAQEQAVLLEQVGRDDQVGGFQQQRKRNANDIHAAAMAEAVMPEMATGSTARVR